LRVARGGMPSWPGTLQGERDTPAASFSCASCCPSRAAREMLTPFVNLTVGTAVERESESTRVERVEAARSWERKVEGEVVWVASLANVVERTSAQQEGFTSEEKEQIRRVVHEVEAEDGHVGSLEGR
jgi:hypothetical protein